MDKQKLVIAGILASVAVGYGAGFYHGQNSADAELTERLASAKKFFPASLQDPHFFTGVVKEKKDSVLMVEKSQSLDPFEEMPMREILITPQTIFIKRTLIDPTEFLGIGNGSAPALPYRDQQVSASDIVPGDTILVEARDDIGAMKRFEAKTIIIQTPQ